MESNRSLLISVVSGKGGVGKTMLAVAAARELAANAPTLLLDLDFFNRGLTGLMRQGRVVQKIDPPAFFASTSSSESSKPWELVEVAPDLFHVRYPDFTPEQIQALEESTVTELAQSLRSFLGSVQSAMGYQAAVIDCHGGPDQLSFAACLISDFSLLVSEPDKITFYGTLHFLRQLRQSIPAGSGYSYPDVRLVFNKVVPAFSGIYLRRLYDSEIRPLFDGRELLAVFPLEIYLTKEFERTPFLTVVYPFSLLAKKTRVLLRDLLQGSHPQLVPKTVRHALRLRLAIVRNSLGKTPWCLDLNIIMATIAVGALLILGFQLYFGQYLRSDYSKYGEVMIAVQQLEMVRFADAHLEAIPKECRDVVWSRRLECWNRYIGRHRRWKRGELINVRPIGTRYVFILSEYRNTKLPSTLQSYQTTWDGSELQQKLQGLLDSLNYKHLDLVSAYKTVDEYPVPSTYQLIAFQLYKQLDIFVEPLGMTALGWFSIALLALWSGAIDRAFTYSARNRHLVRAFFILLVAVLLWSVPLGVLGSLWHTFLPMLARGTAFSASQRYDIRYGTVYGLIGIFLILWMSVIWQQWLKGYQNFRYETLRFEGFARVAFGLYAVAIPLLFAFHIYRI